MKSRVAFLLTLTILISPIAIQTSESAEQSSDSTRSVDTGSTKTEPGSTDDVADEGKVRQEKVIEEEEPDCD